MSVSSEVVLQVRRRDDGDDNDDECEWFQDSKGGSRSLFVDIREP
jgi:hypothetical protein